MQMSAMKAAFKLPSTARFIKKEGRGDFRKKTPKLREISSRIKNTSKNLVVSQKTLIFAQ